MYFGLVIQPRVGKVYFRTWPQNCGKRLLASWCLYVCPSVRMGHLGSHWTNFNENWYLWIFETLSRESKFIKIWREMRVLYVKTLFAFMCSSRMINIADKICSANQTHVLCSIAFLWKSRRLWDSVERYGRHREATADSIIPSMRFTCWVTTATDRHLENIILIAFSRQQWLRESA
jgi:hypothetical protein